MQRDYSLTEIERRTRKEKHMRSLFEFFKVRFSAPNPFDPGPVEEKFQSDYAKRFLAHRRAMAVLAVMIGLRTAFGISRKPSKVISFNT
jgi:hypothetical protein